jgi:hypothetical protein
VEALLFHHATHLDEAIETRNTRFGLWSVIMDIAEVTIKWLPLWALAGSAVFYVWNIIKELENNKHQKLFDLMKIIDSKDPIASKTAAAYHLRFFPKHAEFISRFCSMASTIVEGESGFMLVSELELTKAHVEKHYMKI